MAIDSALGRLGIKQGVCTSSTRPTNPFEGQVIYESDTNRTLVYDNAAWVVVADNQVLSIDAPNSRVGIGTASPNSKVHIVGDSSTNPTNIFAQGYVADGTVDTRTGTIRNTFDSNADYGTYWTGFRGANGGSYKSLFGVRTGGTDNDVLTVDSSGNVGIGTTSPSTPLEVVGDIHADTGSIVVNRANTDPISVGAVHFQIDGTTYSTVRQNSAGRLQFTGDIEVQGQSYTRANWCAMSGPRQFKSAYWNTWYHVAWNTGGAGSVVCYPHFDSSLFEYDGIEIFRTGHFLVEYGQRNNGGTYNAYGGIGESGSRTALAGASHNRGTDGIWSHDHALNNSSWIHSYYIGRLYVGDIVTAGPASNTDASNMLFANGNYAGFVSVIWLGDHDGT